MKHFRISLHPFRSYKVSSSVNIELQLMANIFSVIDQLIKHIVLCITQTVRHLN